MQSGGRLQPKTVRQYLRVSLHALTCPSLLLRCFTPDLHDVIKRLFYEGTPPLGAGSQAGWTEVAKRVRRLLGRPDDKSLPTYIGGELAHERFMALVNKDFPTGGIDYENVEHMHMTYFKECYHKIEDEMGSLEAAVQASKPAPSATKKKPEAAAAGGYASVMPHAEVRHWGVGSIAIL